MTTTPATAEQLAAECKRLASRLSDASYKQGADESRESLTLDQKNADRVHALLIEVDSAIDALAAMAKAAEGANASAQQSGEAVAWLWEYIGKDPYPASLYKGKYIARSLVAMDPKSPPYPDTWRPVRPLYTRPQQVALTAEQIRAERIRTGNDHGFMDGVKFAEEHHGIGRPAAALTSNQSAEIDTSPDTCTPAPETST